KARIVLRLVDIGETQADDLGLWVPAGELLGHLLAEELRQRIGRLRHLDLLIDRYISRPARIRNPVDGFARRPHYIADVQSPRRLEDVVGGDEIDLENHVVRRFSRRGDSTEVDNSVDLLL